jgi:hypothetical protein
MEPDRFGDVSFRILDDPEPPPERGARRWRRRRWTIAVPAALLAAGSLAAGASALTGSNPPAPLRQFPSTHGVRTAHSGPQCHAGQAHGLHIRPQILAPAD